MLAIKKSHQPNHFQEIIYYQNRLMRISLMEIKLVSMTMSLKMLLLQTIFQQKKLRKNINYTFIHIITMAQVSKKIGIIIENLIQILMYLVKNKILKKTKLKTVSSQILLKQSSQELDWSKRMLKIIEIFRKSQLEK